MVSEMTSPLAPYRAMASFCPIKLRNVLEGEEHVQAKKEISEILEKDPLFARDYRRLSLSEAREINHKRWKKMIEYNLPLDPHEDYARFQALLEVLETYDQGLSGRLALHANVFGSAIMSMGTERHEAILEQTKRNEIVGCFCLTELSHGSNTQEVQTIVSFDRGEFVFNSPHEGAIKVWAGNLALSATHAVVFAQLHVDNKNQGLHAFVIQVRDPKTYKTLPGITIGDMGEKPGDWNKVENGWMEFKNYRAPLWALLNKGCDVTEDGKYKSSYKSTSERQSVSLGALSIGRIGIVGKGAMACGLASTIAIRYSAARRQFGPAKGEEIPVLEYPLQQHRLFPYLATHIATKVFHKRFMDYFTDYMIRMMGGEKSEELAEFSKEVHALSSSAKPVSTWVGVEALAEARRACGGHGYLHSSRLNDLRDTFDPTQTFEGENNILLQQTSNILLAKVKSGTLSTPMSTFNFIRENQPKFSGVSNNPVHDALNAYKWLITYLLRETQKDYDAKLGNGSFAARNNTQIYRAHPLSIAYAEHTIIDWFSQFVETVEDASLKKVLSTVCVLYSSFVLEKHLASLYIGGYCAGPTFGEAVRNWRLESEKALATEAVALVDAIAPNDFLLHSTLGMSDGNAYDHLMKEFRTMEWEKVRPNWWKDISMFIESRKEKSKL